MASLSTDVSVEGVDSKMLVIHAYLFFLFELFLLTLSLCLCL